ncbi:MAG: 16S rRNA (guanine(966)-N(2))-methyltransferase RsmD [Candidatus Omnitrophota bacterium]|jgi:16S rRNA (guanine(966)-N(2))-methyltransferase RsmD
MRIIAGEFKGRKIKSPRSETVRPTKDRIRESVFNIIAQHVPGSCVLDLFAGSGAYGLEAISRGAKKAVFVEKGKEANRAIKENIELLDAAERSELLNQDVFDSLEALNKDKERFGLIFADPPYGKGMAKKTLIMINQYDILLASGLFIIEHNSEERLPQSEESVTALKEKTYGNITISIYSRK